MEKTNTVKDFIVENFLFGDAGKLTDNTDLFKESFIDSTGILELIAFLETKYNFHIEDSEMVQDNFSSIIAINKYLHTKNVNTINTTCAD